MKNILELQNCVHRVASGELSVSLASKICGYTAQHIRVMTEKYKIRGDSVFIHGNKGRSPALKTAAAMRKKIVETYHKEYEGLNFAFFADCLREFKGISISNKTVYNILTQEGISSPEKKNVTKEEKMHRPRMRRAHEGELLQIDATPYDWFGDGHRYSLHGSIDDATGKLTGLYMCVNECLYGYLELIRQTFFKHGGGHPAAIYSDRSAIFCKTKQGSKELTVAEQLAGLHESHTQWQRVLSELGVTQILAWSPQAKGRIERVWRTLQGQLPTYFKEYGIKDINTANVWLNSTFLDIFNKKFSVPPADSTPVWHKTYKDPDYILCARYPRKTSSAGIFSFEGYKWLLDKPRAANISFDLCVSEKGIRAYKDGEWYGVKLLEDIQEVEGEHTPYVLKEIIYKYMYKDGKKESD